MKLSCPLALLVLFAISFILAACGLESQPATPTIEHTITETPQPSLTPAPTEIPLPEGAEELIDRLGESASVEMNESGIYDLVYNNLVIGEFDKGRQLSISVEEVTVSISTEDLEVKDGVLVSINRQRTEEMGVDWVEYAWINGKILPIEAATLKPISFASEVITKDNIDRLQVLQIEGLGFVPGSRCDIYVSPIDNDLMITTNTKISFLDPDTLEEKRRIEIPTLYQKAYPVQELVSRSGSTPSNE